jgi:putative hydrolase of the HAD superfamily
MDENIKVIAFDADDTLWANEPIFQRAEEQCKQILEEYVDPKELSEKLYQTEMKNLQLFGYGIKGFMLSLIETAVELSCNKVNGEEVQQIIDLGKEMIQHPVELLEGVEETVENLKEEYTLMILTKGDLFDQESKIARSGLDPHFDYVEIVSEKDESAYTEILSRYEIAPSEFLMVGNSLKSDVLPVEEIGAHAIHIPFHVTWNHESVDLPETSSSGYHQLEDVSLVPEFIQA